MGKEIGIDFGTTNTVVSYVNRNGRLRQLRLGQEEVIPSVIYFKSKDEYFIGNGALERFRHNPKAGAKNFKPEIGNRDRKEIIPDEGAPFWISARDIAKLFLNKIVNGLEARLIKEFGATEGVVDSAVITVPAKFNSTQKTNTKRAARDAGFRNIKLAAEPTAAAIAYEDSTGEQDSDAVILVYDFGGGTFDVSIIRRKGGAFDEINTGGDKTLGGNNLTDSIFREVLAKINEDYGVNFPADEDDFEEEDCGISLEYYQITRSNIWFAANLLKEELSTNDNAVGYANIYLPSGKNENAEIFFSRDELEACIGDDIERTVEITMNTIREAAGVTNIDRVVLAGGSSNIPLVKERLEDCLQNQDVVFDENVSTLISRGAAILANRQGIDRISKAITSVQMGIVATEGVQYRKFQMIIPADEPLPCRRKKIFYLTRDNQRRLEIEYYERDIKNYPNSWRADHNGIEQIDSLVIDNLPENLKADEVQVEVEFIAQKDGSLDMNVELMDNLGNKISGGNMTFNKKSDLE